jgi:hypothetical protein
MQLMVAGASSKKDARNSTAKQGGSEQRVRAKEASELAAARNPVYVMTVRARRQSVSAPIPANWNNRA